MWYINLLMEDIPLCSIHYQHNRKRVQHSHCLCWDCFLCYTDNIYLHSALKVTHSVLQEPVVVLQKIKKPTEAKQRKPRKKNISTDNFG